MRMPVRFRDVRGLANKLEWILLRLFAVLAVSAATGCLSVARIPVREFTVRNERGEIVEERYDSCVGHVAEDVGIYPTMKMRWKVLKSCWNGEDGNADRPMRRVGGIAAVIGLTVGLPFDFIVDTAFAYSDNRRHNGGGK